MPLISSCLYDTFFLVTIWNSNQRWIWNNNLWHHVHLRPSPQLSCSPTKYGRCFQFMSTRAIFQELCATSGDIIQLIPFVHAFYAFVFPLFCNHYNCEDNVIIDHPIYHGYPSKWSHGKGIITLTHFKALRFTTSHFSFYLFSSIANDIHIISFPSIMSSTYEHF